MQDWRLVAGSLAAAMEAAGWAPVVMEVAVMGVLAEVAREAAAPAAVDWVGAD